jgi:hypothetical protein
MLDMTPEIRKLILWARMIHITGLLMIFSSFNLSRLIYRAIRAVT